MKARDVIRRLKDHGCTETRQKGSHKRFVSPSGSCFTTVPSHAGEDIKRGTLNGIETDMEACLGKGWLTHG